MGKMAGGEEVDFKDLLVTQADFDLALDEVLFLAWQSILRARRRTVTPKDNEPAGR